MVKDPQRSQWPGSPRIASAGELVDVATHASQHRYVRRAHETELIEDYVEMIGDLMAANGEARAADLARRMDVSHATVAKMVRRLTDLGLVTSAPYRSIFLTDEGQRMAAKSRERHAIVLRFLKALGVDDTNARQDAEGVEHHVCSETLEQMRAFLNRKDT